MLDVAGVFIGEVLSLHRGIDSRRNKEVPDIRSGLPVYFNIEFRFVLRLFGQGEGPLVLIQILMAEDLVERDVMGQGHLAAEGGEEGIEVVGESAVVLRRTFLSQVLSGIRE